MLGNIPPAVIKYHDIWAKNWGTPSLNKVISPPQSLEKLIIYFPKTPKAIIAVSDLLENVLSSTGDLILYQKYKGLTRRVLHRYRKGLLRSIKPNNIRKDLLDCSLLRSTKSASANSRVFTELEELHTLLKAVNQNKRIKTIQFGGHTPSSFVRKCNKSSRHLCSMEINNMIAIDESDYKVLFSNRCLRKTLESFTVTGAIEKSYSIDSHFFKDLLELKSLRDFKLDGGYRDNLEVNNVPFGTLMKRGIRFDIRICHSTEEIIFSRDNMKSLQSLDFLGINVKSVWGGLEQQHTDISRKENLKLQAEAKNLLFVSLFTLQKIHLFTLFQACWKITTLDLIVTGFMPDTNFEGLQDLCNLQNLFLHIEDIGDRHEAIFQKLSIQGRKHNSLKCVSIKLLGTVVLNQKTTALQEFFEACADTVTKMILQVIYKSFDSKIEIKGMYKGLEMLSKLNSLAMYIGESYISYTTSTKIPEYHAGHIDLLLKAHPKLDEFYLLIPHHNCLTSQFDLGHVKELTKLVLNLSTGKLSLSMIESCFDILGLRYLDLSLDKKVSVGEWRAIVVGIRSLKKLEIAKIKCGVKCGDNEINMKEDFDILMKMNPKLNLLALEDITGELKVLIFKRRKLYGERMDNLFEYNDLGGLPGSLPEVHLYD